MKNSIHPAQRQTGGSTIALICIIGIFGVILITLFKLFLQS